MLGPHHDDELQAHSSDISSDLPREQVPAENLREGGIRFRENLGKYVVEYRPPHFKWKLWMGTYSTEEEARRAADCARFYAGQDNGGFYFRDSPALFRELGPLAQPFSSVSKDVKDKTFNVELKKRAKMVIRNVRGAESAGTSVASPVSVPLPEAMTQLILGERMN